MNVDDSIHVFEEFNISVPLLNGVNEPRTKHEGHHFSDYVLLRKERKAFAAVEAKKKSIVDANIDKEQTKQNCHRIQNEKGGELPFFNNLK
ncbi:hypothetical protein [Flavobacterium tructae]|uniref:hypothetical protein n=1 Tax=Flavobacterium tructae TaxID=1114873 RepID=UPI0035A949BD